MFWSQHVDGVCEVIHLVNRANAVLGNLHGYTLAGWLSVASLDPLVHAIQNGACEVRLGVRQSLRIVCPCCLAEGKEALSLKVVP